MAGGPAHRAEIENGEISVSLNLFITKVEYRLIETSILQLLFTKSLISTKLELTKLGCLLYITLFFALLVYAVLFSATSTEAASRARVGCVVGR